MAVFTINLKTKHKMKIKTLLYIFVLNIVYLNIEAQNIAFDNDSNLIYNPSFENHYSCPARIDPYGIMDEVVGWWQPTRGSSDYYNNCGGRQCHVPKNKLGFQMPKTGESMVGIYCSLTDYREYLETELKQELIAGEKYKLSFWVSLSEYSKEAVATVGGLFTKERIDDTTRQMLVQNNYTIGQNIRQNLSTYYKPQVVNSFNNPLTDVENWVNIQGEFIAQGGEKFLTLGNFYPAEQSNVVDLNYLTHVLPGAYYYVEDVELYCLTCDLPKESSPIVTKTIEDTNKYEVGKVIVLKNIFFDFDKSVLLPQSYVELLNLLTLLNKYPNMKIELSGHTDNKGKDRYNLELSDNRAKAVYDYLIKEGIDKKRLKYKGYGSERPIATNKTENGRAQNRRVEFKITQM